MRRSLKIKAGSVPSVADRRRSAGDSTWIMTIDPWSSGVSYVRVVTALFPPGSILTGYGRQRSISTVRFQLPLK